MIKSLKSALLLPTVVAMSFTAVAQAPAQPKLLEKVVRKGTDLVIPYEKYVLPNGLTVILAGIVYFQRLNVA